MRVLIGCAACLLLLAALTKHSCAESVHIVKVTDGQMAEVSAFYTSQGYTIQAQDAEKGYLAIIKDSVAASSTDAAAAAADAPLATAAGVEFILPYQRRGKGSLPKPPIFKMITKPKIKEDVPISNQTPAVVTPPVSAASVSPMQASSSEACRSTVENPLPNMVDNTCSRGKECTGWGVRAVSANDQEILDLTKRYKDKVMHCILFTGVDKTHPDVSGANLYGCTPGGVHKDQEVNGTAVPGTPMTCKYPYTLDTTGEGASLVSILAGSRNNVGMVGVAADAPVYVHNVDGDLTTCDFINTTWKSFSDGLLDCYAAFTARKLETKQDDLKLVINMPYALTRSNGEDNPYCPRGAPWNATKDYLEFFGLVDTVRNLGDLPEVLMVADGGLPSGGLTQTYYPAAFPEVVSVARMLENYSPIFPLDPFSFPNPTVKNEWLAPGHSILSARSANGARPSDLLIARGKIGVEGGWTPPAGDEKILTVPEPAVAWSQDPSGFLTRTGKVTAEMVYVGTATPEEFAGVNVTGKICLAIRGANTFGEKVSNCALNGAAAVVVFNRDDLPPCEIYADPMINPVSFSLSLVQNSPDSPVPVGGFPPALYLSNKQGRYIKGLLEGNPAQKFTVERYHDPPSPPLDYVFSSSSAVMIAAGVAGIVWQGHRDCSAQQIREAIGASAKKLPSMEFNTRDPLHGYGLINALAAHQYLLEHPCSPDSVRSPSPAPASPSPSPSPKPSPSPSPVPPGVLSTSISTNATAQSKVGDTILVRTKLSSSNPAASVEGTAVELYRAPISVKKIECDAYLQKADKNGETVTSCKLKAAGKALLRARAKGVKKPASVTITIKRS